MNKSEQEKNICRMLEAPLYTASFHLQMMPLIDFKLHFNFLKIFPFLSSIPHPIQQHDDENEQLNNFYLLLFLLFAKEVEAQN